MFENIDRDMNLRDFEKTDVYNNSELSFNFGSYFPGYPIVIDGDIKKISIVGKNEIQLLIIYNILNSSDEQLVTVAYKFGDADTKEYYERIRKYVRSSTYIKLRATFTKKFAFFDGGEILSYNEPLKYGHYICPDCGYDYGINLGRDLSTYKCEICGPSAKHWISLVTDFYKDLKQ